MLDLTKLLDRTPTSKSMENLLRLLIVSNTPTAISVVIDLLPMTT